MSSSAVIRVNSRPLVIGLVLGAIGALAWHWQAPETVEKVTDLVTAFVTTFAVIAVSIVPFTDRDRGADLIRRLHSRATGWSQHQERISDWLTRFGASSGAVGGFTLTSSALALLVNDAESSGPWWAGGGMIAGFLLALLLASIGRGQAPRTAPGDEESSIGAA